MPLEININKKDYINLIESIRKELNTATNSKNFSTEMLQDILSRSLNFKNHVDVLAYFAKEKNEKENNNFLFKKNFFLGLSLQCKNDDSLSERSLLLAEVIILISDYKSYKLSQRSIERLLPLSTLLKIHKDNKTPQNIKGKIESYMKNLIGYKNMNHISSMVQEQHRLSMPYILIACKMSQ